MKWEERKDQRLYQESSLTSFFPISPLDPDGASKSCDLLKGRIFWRKELADILEPYNRLIGNDAAAQQKIETFRKKSTYCVITGQQLGLFGGPSYTLLKAISCLILARQHDAVPIFWLATEDHDIDEIDHTYLINALGNLSKISLSLPKNGQFVEEISLNSEHHEEIARFLDLVDQKSLAAIIKQETSYCRAMAKVLVTLFKGTGMVFVEPALLRPLAKSFFVKEIENCETIQGILQKTTRALIEAGGTPALDVAQGTNLFLKVAGKYRRKILFENNSFFIGNKNYTKDTLLKLIEDEPERFSTNAQARCVLQNTLFPVLAYVAGPGELNYYHQLADYHQFHEISVPWIVPRISATFLTPQAQQMLHQCRLFPWDKIPTEWSQIVPGIEAGKDQLTHQWVQSARKIYGEEVSEESLIRFVRHQVEKIQRKATLSRLRKQGIAPHSLHYLRNLIHPHDKLQERVINWWEFQSCTQTSIIHEFINTFKEIPEGHLYCYL